MLLYCGISSTRKILNDTDEEYQYMVEKGHSKLFELYRDQIFISQACYKDVSHKNSYFK